MMSKLEKKTILLNTIFNFGASLVSSFISVYLYIYTNSIPIMSLYIIVRIGLFPIFFMLGSRMVKKHSFTITYAIGLFLITAALAYVLFSGPLFERNAYYVLIAAAIIGSGEGFFYFSSNTCNQIVSTIETRANFLSYNGVFNNLGSLFSPIFASFLLAISPSETEAYRRMLMVIIAIFIIVIFIALTINAHSTDKGSSVIESLKISNDRQWNDHNLAVFLYGLRDGLGLNTINLLVYRAAGSGGIYSRLQTLFLFVSMLAYYATKYMMNRKMINRTFKLGVVLKMAGTFFLIYMPTTLGACIYGILNAFAAAFYDNTYSYISSSIIGRYEGEMTARVVAKETYLSLGRCVSMATVLLAYRFLPEDIYLNVSVTLLAFAPILVERILIRYK